MKNDAVVCDTCECGSCVEDRNKLSMSDPEMADYLIDANFRYGQESVLDMVNQEIDAVVVRINELYVIAKAKSQSPSSELFALDQDHQSWVRLRDKLKERIKE